VLKKKKIPTKFLGSKDVNITNLQKEQKSKRKTNNNLIIEKKKKTKIRNIQPI